MWDNIRVGKLFTQRHKAESLTLSKEILPLHRNRLMHLINGSMNQQIANYKNPYSVIAGELFGRYGQLKLNENSPYRNSGFSPEVLMEHLQLCSNDEFLDYIEIAMFYINHNEINYCVSQANEIFREVGLSYVLTPYTQSDEIDSETGRRYLNSQYPQIILVDNQFTHQEIIVPALNLLTNPALSVVNQELLEAFHHIRDKKYADAITRAASSLESMFKVIFKREKMALPNNTALGRLVTEFFNQEKLPKHYENSFFAVTKIRNEISSSHGREGQLIAPPTFIEAEHVVHLVASNIMFLARKYGMES